MAEFPELGVHCSLDRCRKLDFMPFLCKLCRCFYCGEHRFDHTCKPTENQVLSVTKSDDGKFKQFLCSKNGCFEMEWIKMLCSYCDTHFCMKHRNCEDHECKGLAKPAKKENDAEQPVISSEIVIKAPKKNVDPAQQARADKIAVMRLKAKNAFKIPLEDALFTFVNYNSERYPCMISKNWSVNRCKTAFLVQCGLKESDSGSFNLYSEEGDENLNLLKLDLKAELCMKDMQDVHLLPVT